MCYATPSGERLLLDTPSGKSLFLEAYSVSSQKFYMTLLLDGEHMLKIICGGMPFTPVAETSLIEQAPKF
jgi:hypothetical protein